MSTSAYPPDLTDFVLQQWPTDRQLGLGREHLAEALSICFLASLTTDEGRPVRFRLLLAPASDLPDDGAPNRGVLRLRFEESRPFEVDELRRLSSAAPFDTTLIAAHLEGGELRIWGVAHSGAAWLAPSWGGRSANVIWSAAPIVHVTGPGRIAVRSSGKLVAGLERGALISSAMDVFESDWLPELFAQVRDDLRREHRNGLSTSDIDNSLIQTVGQHMVRRVVRLIRGADHGGMILIADPEEAERFRNSGGPVRLKYTFSNDEPRRRYSTLLRRLMMTLATASQKGIVGWEDFRDAEDPALEELEQSIFELSRLVAGLAAADGAVLLDKRLELIGFGAEVSAELPSPENVWRAFDVEGRELKCDRTESVGTRHRAAYRFAKSHPGSLAIVISQDGAVRFVTSREGAVVYWEQSVSP